MSKIRNLRVLTILTAAVLAALTMALVAPSSEAREKPDLVVTSAQLTSPNVVFSGEQSTFTFTDTTKNKGDAVARSSTTVLKLNETDEAPGLLEGLTEASRDVPKLKPGKQNKGQGSGTHYLSRNLIGSYYAFVCADPANLVKESNEGNNCKRIGVMSIIPKSWRGTVNGSAVVKPGVTETWTAQDMTFAFDSYSAPYFDYTASGDVNYSISGTDDEGCEWSGSGTVTVQNLGQLRLHQSLTTYEGLAMVTPPVYTITKSCPNGGNSTQDGPGSSTWLHTGAPSPTIANPFGVTTLAGSYTSPVTPSGQSVHWEWNLEAP